eukprot:1313918-Rhodomonas_salina.1
MLRRRLQARQNQFNSHVPLQASMDYAASPVYGSESPSTSRPSPAPESEMCREISLNGDDKYELEFAWVHGWLGRSTGAASVSLEFSVQRQMYEVVVRSARECILIPLAGDVRVNVDHRVVRIGLADKTVHLRFLNLRDSCRFTALVLEVMEKLLRDPPPG